MKPLTHQQEAFLSEYLRGLPVTDACAAVGLTFVECGIGFYVYFLIDPRDDAIFYVGKGKGKRMFSHSKRVGKTIDNAEKVKRIRAIHEAGQNVRAVAFSTHDREQDAFAAERIAISMLRDRGLTNIVGGVVSNAEAAQIMAEDGLRRFKDFAHWVVTATDAQMACATRLGDGDPRRCYDNIKAELEGYLHGTS